MPPRAVRLAGDAPNLTYTPAGDFTGDVTFTYTVSDGTAVSAAATVTITVRPSNTAPTVEAVVGTVSEGQAVQLNLLGDDDDEDPLTYRLIAGPGNDQGTATIEDNVLTYTAPAGFEGELTFSYVANDGVVDSEAADITITVSFNRPPTADNIAASTDEDTTAAITLTGADPENEALTYEIIAGPTNGVLAGCAQSDLHPGPKLPGGR